jgi:hypothetical protein
MDEHRQALSLLSVDTLKQLLSEERGEEESEGDDEQREFDEYRLVGQPNS